MNHLFTISPVAFAISGFILFMLGRIFRNRYSIYLTVAGIFFVCLFFYKLWLVQHNFSASPVRLSGEIYDFQFSFILLSFLIIGINILGLILCLVPILKALFSRIIPKPDQTKIILSGSLVLVVSLVIFLIFGNLIGAICFPVISIIYYLYVEDFYKKRVTV